MVEACVVTVRGRVQRVGYRRFVCDTADELGVAGSVKNEVDGSVTIFAQGEPEVLKRFAELVGAPLRGRVSQVAVEESVPKPGLGLFAMEMGTVQEEIQDALGMEREFREYREEFRDYVQEFRDHREDFKDYREEFKDYRKEFRGFADRTDKNFQVMADKYCSISETIAKLLDAFTAETVESRRRHQELQEELHRSVESLAKAVDALIEVVRGQKSTG